MYSSGVVWGVPTAPMTSGDPPVHAGRALRSRRCENDLVNRPGANKRNLLDDEAPDRKAKEIDLLDVHGVEKPQ